MELTMNGISCFVLSLFSKLFTLCADYFGIKYNSMKEVYHLIDVIKKYFKLSIDWEGQNYLGLTLDWNCV